MATPKDRRGRPADGVQWQATVPVARQLIGHHSRADRSLLRPAARPRLLLLLLALGLVVGCAAAPPRYRYRPPAQVRTEDLRACHVRADASARQRYDRYMEIVELAGPFGGPFGGITLAQRAWEEREDFYEWEMKSCLRERGYAL